MQLVLASGSPRRQELLALLGHPFTTIVSNIEEEQLAHETASQYVQRLATEKAQAGGQLAFQQGLACDRYLVIGSDTVVVKDDQVFEKPADLTHSQQILLKLSNTTHQVMTAVCVSLFEQGKLIDNQPLVVTTDVTFKPLSTQEIEQYWQSGEPQDKAGSYGIQGIGGKFVTNIHGSYHAVVGLPLYETNQLLQNFLKS